MVSIIAGFGELDFQPAGGFKFWELAETMLDVYNLTRQQLKLFDTTMKLESTGYEGQAADYHGLQAEGVSAETIMFPMQFAQTIWMRLDQHHPQTLHNYI